MAQHHKRILVAWSLLACFLIAAIPVYAQDSAILGEEQLSKVVPSNFYFEGQLGPTQMRNAAAISFKSKNHFVAALIDTSGYASNIRTKYEGFIITDLAVSLGGIALPVGAYGFGFTEDAKVNIFDLSGKLLHSMQGKKDSELRGPRPLMITKSGSELRLYRGRSFLVLAPK